MKDENGIEIEVLDEKGAGGAHHEYLITKGVNSLAVIHFQNGPIQENGINGVQQEHLLEVVRHRLQCFQAGDFACRENALALTKIEEALHWLNHRTDDRRKRGVEGTNSL